MLAGVIGLIGGVTVNLAAGDAAWVKAITIYVTGPAGQVFLRLLFTLALSTISVVVALVLVNLVRPDPALARAMPAQAGSGASAIVAQGREQPGRVDAVLGIIPSNAVKAAADDDILAPMVFAPAIH